NGLLGFDQAEWRWASQTVAASLDRVMASAAHDRGWNYVDTVAAKFRTHGYCSGDSWLRQMTVSLRDQGSRDGTLHPNRAGQDAIRDSILARLLNDLRRPPTPPTIRMSPSAAVFAFDVAGANGWWTGECSIAV